MKAAVGSTGGFSRLGHQQSSAGLTVKTIYQRNLPTVCELIAQQGTELMPQCPRAVRFGRVCQQARRLVHHQKVFRFTQDLELRLILCLHAASFKN